MHSGTAFVVDQHRTNIIIIIIAITIILSGNVHLLLFLFLFYSFTRVRPVLPLKAIGVKFVNAPGFSFVCSFVCLSSRLRQTERYLLIFPFLFLSLLIYVRISLRLVAYPLTFRTCAAVWGIIIHQK